MSNNKHICNISDLVDYDDLDELLKQSGILITSSDTKESKKSSDDNNGASQKVLQDPFATAINDPIQPEVKSEKNLDNCLICYNPLYMKITLKCTHSFCFNCIKGQIIRQTKSQPINCPLCNQPIANQMIELIKKKPHLLDSIEIQPSYLDNLNAYWFYSSRDRSWWSFDIPSSVEIEALYQKFLKNEDISKSNRLSICGMTRIYDFDDMLQINEYNDNTRRIKRVEKKDIEIFMKKNKVKGLSGYKSTI